MLTLAVAALPTIATDPSVSRVAKPASELRLDTCSRRSLRLLAQFTPRDLHPGPEFAQGLATAELAERLGIASNTVEWHVGHLIEKLQVHSKLQALLEAARKGLIDV